MHEVYRQFLNILSESGSSLNSDDLDHKIERVKSLLKESVKLNPFLVDSYKALAKFFTYFGDINSARDYYDKVIEIDCEDLEAIEEKFKLSFDYSTAIETPKPELSEPRKNAINSAQSGFSTPPNDFVEGLESTDPENPSHQLPPKSYEEWLLYTPAQQDYVKTTMWDSYSRDKIEIPYMALARLMAQCRFKVLDGTIGTWHGGEYVLEIVIAYEENIQIPRMLETHFEGFRVIYKIGSEV